MFVLKSLGKMILGNTEQKELLAIPGGKLLVFHKDKKHEEYFGDAKLSLERAEKQFRYKLVVEDTTDKESPEEFPLTTDLQFLKTQSPIHDLTCFQWTSGELNFEFIMPDTASTTTIEMFQVTVAQCLFEYVEGKSHSTASDADIKKYVVSVPLPRDTPTNLIEADELIKWESKVKCGWYVFDPSTNLFSPQSESVLVRITREKPKITEVGKNKKKELKSFRFYLNILDGVNLKTLHRQVIDPDATHHTDRPSHSYIWCQMTDNGYIWTYSLRFPDPASVMGLSNAIGEVIYEILNEEEMDKADSSYLLNPFAALTVKDVEMKEAPPLEVKSDEESESNDDLDLEDDYEKRGTFKEDDPFSHLAVGYKHDRSFVAKGSSLGVFKHTSDDRLEHYTTVEGGIKTKSGKTFNPSKMMLHQEDSTMILMNPDDQKHLYKMDLEVGKVVEEWTVHDKAPVTNILPSAKYAQMTGEATLIGLNDSALFRIDPRLSGNKRVETEMKSYAVKNKFSCGTTTGSGELAVASAKGDIRLFNKLDKRAKTLLPGFGDAIIGIDVTESGRWIVATCKTYLLLICTEIPGTDDLGFSKSMGAEKPAPLRLTLKPEHVAFMGTPISFTPARFSTGQSEEKSIITSTGPFVVSWNFRRLKQGKVHDYQIKRYSDTIVADNFRFGQDRAMIVTLPHHVTMMTKKSLSTPSPKTLRQRNDVVDAPF